MRHDTHGARENIGPDHTIDIDYYTLYIRNLQIVCTLLKFVTFRHVAPVLASNGDSYKVLWFVLYGTARLHGSAPDCLICRKLVTPAAAVAHMPAIARPNDPPTS